MTIRTAELPVSRARLPGVIAGLVEEHRPDFYVSLGLATGGGGAALRDDGDQPRGFRRGRQRGREAHRWRPRSSPKVRPPHFATWDAAALAGELLDNDLPAIVSHHAGTHLCNLVLYCAAGAMACAGLDGPVGFLHLPYTPKQVARFLKNGPPGGDTAPMTPRALPSMPLATQEAALRLMLAGLVRQLRAADA